MSYVVRAGERGFRFDDFKEKYLVSFGLKLERRRKSLKDVNMDKQGTEYANHPRNRSAGYRS